MNFIRLIARPGAARWLFLSTLSGMSGLLTLGAGTPALASSGMGIIAMPDGVDREPSAAAATRVRLSGVFSVGAEGRDPCYTPPQCGTLYFACPAGKEALCRMEWAEIASAAAAGKCVAFGSTRTETGTPQNNGRIRAAGDALGEPDPYPLGMGVLVVGCARQELSCQSTPDLVAARAKDCAASPGDGGAGGSIGGGGTGGQGGSSGGTGGTAVGGGAGSGTGGPAAGGGSSDGGTRAEPASKSGCALAGDGAPAGRTPWIAVLIVGAMVAVGTRRGRRSGQGG